MELLQATSSNIFPDLVTGFTNSSVTSLITVVALAVGIPLAFYVIEGILSFFDREYPEEKEFHRLNDELNLDDERL